MTGYKKYRVPAAAGATMLIIIIVAAAAPASDDLAEVMRQSLPSGAAILIDLEEGVVVASCGGEMLLAREGGRPAGSILKLFTIYALLVNGAPTDEVIYCGPSSSDVPATQSCWYRPGHGNMTLVSALANSCNAYFRGWVARYDTAAAEALFRKLRLLGKDLEGSNEEKAAALTGLSSEIRSSPAALAAAAAALFSGVIYSINDPSAGARLRPVDSIRLDAPAISAIKAGMRESAVAGTGAAVQEAVGIEPLLVKTGTSMHYEAGELDPLATDGWCLVVFPEGKLSYLLLVFAPGGSGSNEAATAAGKIVAAFLESVQ